MGAGRLHRQWAQLSVNQEISLEPYDPYSDGLDIFIGTLEIQVRLWKKLSQQEKDALKGKELEFDATKMATVLATVRYSVHI